MKTLLEIINTDNEPNILEQIMAKEATEVKAIRSKYWTALQKIADETEEGNLNHLVNKILSSYLKSVGKKRKNI